MIFSPVTAHAGDWITTIILMAPMVAIAIWVAVQRIRERRQGAHPEDADDRTAEVDGRGEE